MRFDLELTFDTVVRSPKVLGIIPPAMEVVINPQRLALPGRGDRPHEVIRRIEQYGQQLMVEAGLEDLDVIVPHASVFAQLDMAYLKETGEKLLRRSFALTTDTNEEGDPILVGRYAPFGGLDIMTYRPAGSFLAVIPVLVLPPRK